MENKKEGIFIEKQKLWRQVIALVVFILLDLLFFWGCVQQIGMGIPWGNQPMSNTALLISTLFLFLLSFSLVLVRLETIVNKKGVYIRYYPIHLRNRFFPWTEISEIQIRNYDPIREYGGWGIKLHLFQNKAYNVYGNIGLQLIMKNGEKILIGTNKPKELAEVLENLQKINVETVS